MGTQTSWTDRTWVGRATERNYKASAYNATGPSPNAANDNGLVTAYQWPNTPKAPTATYENNIETTTRYNDQWSEPTNAGKCEVVDTYWKKDQEVAKHIAVGDFVTRYSPLLEIGDCVNVKSLDNRASVFVLIEALRELKKAKRKPAYDFYAVFTVQEEVGLRGAQAAALKIQADFGFGLDTTIAYDVPGSTPQERCTSLGDGAAIKLMDSSVICDYRMIEFMKAAAKRHKIKWQPEILGAGGTDTGSLQRMVAGGSIVGAVSIPTRHIHQTIESCHKDDIAECIRLLAVCVCELDQHDWKF